jgi:diguanylate cyclase (GGDEF)-like protein/PAS domain S-box-containing protein
MTKMPDSADELNDSLRQRIRHLAEEKSYLQLTLRMIEQLNPLAGVHDMVGHMLHSIVESIGGTDVKIWYWVDEQLRYASVLGEDTIADGINDPIALQVASSHCFIEERSDTANALLMGEVIPGAWHWCFPLLLGNELIGIIKLENINIASNSLRNYLPIFFSHASLILSNEIRNQSRLKALDALREKTAELDAYFNNSLDLFCIADTDGNFRKLNPAWETTLGHPLEEMTGHSFMTLLHPDDVAQTQSAVAELREQRDVLTLCNRYRHKDGSWRWIEWKSRPLGNLIFAAARDVTELRAANDAIRLAASVFSNSQEGIAITDANNDIIDINAAFTRITGYTRDDVIGRNPRLLHSGQQEADFYQAMWRSICETGTWRGEIWNRRKSGEVYAEILSIDAVRDANGKVQHYVGAFSDISQIKEHQAELERIAHFDTLTGLPNRRLLADRLRRELARSLRNNRKLGICYLDLDGFKPVNDTYGHQAGDRLLIEIANRLQHALRAGDTVARLGGDEFVLLCCDLADDAECFSALERVLKAVEQPYHVAEAAIANVSASIGVTIFPRDNADADTLLRHADQAMYFAKENGKARFEVYAPNISSTGGG